jgi:hypothetical protein
MSRPPTSLKTLVSFTLVGAGIGFYVQNYYERKFRDAQYERFTKFLDEKEKAANLQKKKKGKFEN